MEELDRTYNRAIRLAKDRATSLEVKETSDDAYGYGKHIHRHTDLGDGVWQLRLPNDFVRNLQTTGSQATFGQIKSTISIRPD